MPELPEVEFAARRLRVWTAGRAIVRATAQEGTPLRGMDAASFCAGLNGPVGAVHRRGKQLIIELGDVVFLAHLGMTGKFLRQPADAPARSGTRAQIWLDDGHRLDFVDPRRFGRLRIVPAATLASEPELAHLGPDALELATPGLLYERLRGVRRAIKPALLDQHRVAGVGNIYAAEALFRARVSPKRRADRVGRETADRLGAAIVEVMTESLARELDDEISYLQDAESANPFVIYGREGEPCPGCGAPIQRFTQQARSTFWCPRCQPR